MTPSIPSAAQRLAGKVAIVTGLGAGIGQGCAFLFARQGARVVSCDIDAAKAEAALARARAEGLDIECLHPCDLTRPADVRRLVDHTVQRHGRIDVLVNAAAWGAFKPIEQLEFEADWNATLAGEISVVFLACQAAWPHLKKNGGSIVNFASANAYTTLAGSPALAHCAGKGAVLAMTRQLAAEGGPHGIRANTISPGMVETDATRPVLQVPGMVDTVLAKSMLKFVGQPEDIAWCAVFLASDESRYVTAADFSVDGGAIHC